MSLPSQPILIIDQSTESFIEELLNTLVAAGFEPLVAVDEAEALHYLERFDFSAVLLGEQPHFERHLIDAFGGVVVISFGGRIVPIRPPWIAVQRDTSAILRALKDVLG